MVVAGNILVVDGVRAIHKILFTMVAPECLHLLLGRKDAKVEDLQLPWRTITYLNEEEVNAEWCEYARHLHNRYPLAAVVSFHDNYQERALDIASSLNLPFFLSREVILQTRSKRLMRDKLRQAGIEQPAFAMLNSSEDLETFFARHHQSGIVIKPEIGSASEHVLPIQNYSDLLPIKTLCGERGLYPALGEQFIEGQEYSVEAFSSNGCHHFLGLVKKEKFPNSTIEMGHIFPAPLSSELQAAIVQYVGASLDALGLENGPSHTEIILDSRNFPHIVETHTRPGGDQIWRLLLEVTGINLMAICAEFALTGALNTLAGAATNEQRAPAAAIRFAHGTPGKIFTGFRKHAESLCNEFTIEVKNLLEEGQSIPALQSSFDRIGYVMGRGNTPEQSWMKCSEILAGLL